MLTEQQVAHLYKIHKSLYEATRNPVYYAFMMAYENVLGDDIPTGMRGDVEELIEKWKSESGSK